jgi:hypothetical protein
MDMILHGCFDESGKWQDSTYLSFAGYVTSFNVWMEVQREWENAMEKHGLKFLHTKHEKRTEVLMEFAQIIKSKPLFGVCFAIDAAAYSSLSDADKKVLKYKPKQIAFYRTIKGACG